MGEDKPENNDSGISLSSTLDESVQLIYPSIMDRPGPSSTAEGHFHPEHAETVEPQQSVEDQEVKKHKINDIGISLRSTLDEFSQLNYRPPSINQPGPTSEGHFHSQHAETVEPQQSAENQQIKKRKVNYSGISSNSILNESVQLIYPSIMDQPGPSTAEGHIHPQHAETVEPQQSLKNQQVGQVAKPTTCTVQDDVLDPPKKCLLCPFITDRKKAYCDHLPNHFYTENVPKGKGASGSGITVDEDDETESDEESIEDIDQPGPSTKRSRKKKDIHCSKCNFVSTSKQQHWKHLRTHKDQNDYRCSVYKCYFITTVKHHMVQHWLARHDDAKMFSCLVCKYNCVTKAMLKSHEKVHSNVKLFGCLDCPYETKYTNSIRNHLSVNNHRLGIIRNADGTLNHEANLDTFSKKRKRGAAPRGKNPSTCKRPSAASSSQTQTRRGSSAPITTRTNIATATNEDERAQVPSNLLPLPFHPYSFDSINNYEREMIRLPENERYNILYLAMLSLLNPYFVAERLMARVLAFTVIICAISINRLEPEEYLDVNMPRLSEERELPVNSLGDTDITTDTVNDTTIDTVTDTTVDTDTDEGEPSRKRRKN